MLPLLEARNLQKYFPVTKGFLVQRVVGWLKAVDGVEFVIPRGDTLGLVGESGCGKTTVAKLVLLLEKKTAGLVLFDGGDTDRLRGAALRGYRTSVQAVFQDPYSSLNPRMRVGDILVEPLEINHLGSRHDMSNQAKDVLVQVGLPPDAMSMYPHEFSGGQRQRIAIARALVSRPRLIVLDEPVSALDVSIRAQILNLLRDIQGELGVTYLMIAHDISTVRYMSTQIAVMYLGKIVEVGENNQVYSRHLHPYTQALFASSLPHHPRQRREGEVISGEVPSALNPPRGCRFHPRCPYVMAVCREQEPKLREQDKGHRVACHLY